MDSNAINAQAGGISHQLALCKSLQKHPCVTNEALFLGDSQHHDYFREDLQKRRTPLKNRH